MASAFISQPQLRPALHLPSSPALPSHCDDDDDGDHGDDEDDEEDDDDDGYDRVIIKMWMMMRTKRRR